MEFVECEVEIGKLFKAIEKYENIFFNVENPNLLNASIQIQNETNDWINIYAGVIKSDLGVKLHFDNGETLHTASKHLICIDKENCVYVKDLKKGQKIQKATGEILSVSTIENTKETIFYDLSVDSETHLYQTANGLIHHNTEVSKALARCLLDDEAALTRFDMSEYMEKHSVAKLIGAPAGYEGFEMGGILTNAMRKNPRRIVLFDEIEKAHPDVFNLFLQILSDGRLTDNRGLTVSFSESIIIMTSNIGQSELLDESMAVSERQAAALDVLTQTPGIRPEFLNRFAGRQNILFFNILELDTIAKIVRREITNLGNTYKDLGITTIMTDEELMKFCKDQYDPAIGARGLPGFIQANLEPLIVNTVLENPKFKGAVNIEYDVDSKKFDATFNEDKTIQLNIVEG